MPSKQTALNLWTATDNLCQRKVVSLTSPVIKQILRPISSMKEAPEQFTAPRVSKAIGTNELVWARPKYLSTFFAAALSAAPPAVTDDNAKLLAAKVSVTVTSQATHFPHSQGILVTPSGPSFNTIIFIIFYLILLFILISVFKK